MSEGECYAELSLDNTYAKEVSWKDRAVREI